MGFFYTLESDWYVVLADEQIQVKMASEHLCFAYYFRQSVRFCL